MKKPISNVMFGLITILIVIGVISILLALIILSINQNIISNDIDELTSILKKVRSQMYDLDSDLFGYGLHIEDAHYILINLKSGLKENRKEDISYKNKVVDVNNYNTELFYRLLKDINQELEKNREELKSIGNKLVYLQDNSITDQTKNRLSTYLYLRYFDYEDQKEANAIYETDQYLKGRMEMIEDVMELFCNIQLKRKK